MSSIVSVRDLSSGGYSVRTVRGDAVSSEFLVLRIGNLFTLPDAYVRSLHIDREDMRRRYTRRTWVALTRAGTVIDAASTKRELLAALPDPMLQRRRPAPIA